jgi:hypothetical protein
MLDAALAVNVFDLAEFGPARGMNGEAVIERFSGVFMVEIHADVLAMNFDHAGRDGLTVGILGVERLSWLEIRISWEA